MARHNFVVWDKEDSYGTEYVDVSLESDRLSARGVAIGWEPLAYALEFTLETSGNWVTSRLHVESRGQGWRRGLDLRRSAEGVWFVEARGKGRIDLPPPGGEGTPFAAALDCDLGLSPLTNSMPVLRHKLLQRDGSHEFVMAWVSVPDLSVHPSAQRYTTRGEDARGRRIIEYSSIQRDFVSNLTFDDDGLVVDYPRLARRVPDVVR
jgi:hypothetical protein